MFLVLGGIAPPAGILTGKTTSCSFSQKNEGKYRMWYDSQKPIWDFKLLIAVLLTLNWYYPK